MAAATVRAEKPELHAADAYTEVFSEWSARRLPEAAEEHIGPNSPYDHQTTLALRPRRSLHGSRTMTGAASYGIPVPLATYRSRPARHTAKSRVPIPLRRSMFCVYRI